MKNLPISMDPHQVPVSINRKNLRTAPDPECIDAEFSEVAPPAGRRGLNGSALGAADIKREYLERHGREISMEEAERISKMRLADEASIRSEPFILGAMALLMVGCLVTAAFLGGIDNSLLLAGCACLLALAVAGAVVFRCYRSGLYKRT